jgi:prepilin-type processing-associated H-X9-DG protein
VFQVERKRHIGNDIVNIVFVDGGPEEMAREWLDTGQTIGHTKVNCRKYTCLRKIM